MHKSIVITLVILVTLVSGKAFAINAPNPISGPSDSINGSFNLSWPAVNGATVYALFESVNFGTYNLKQFTSSTTFSTSGRSPDTYIYAVAACSATTCSGFSGGKIVTVSLTLTNDARRDYLEYYSPIIMKRSNEDQPNERGLDLITNFDFDRDGDFSNNKYNWEDVYQFVSGNSGLSNWKIRPTIYTAIIEFAEGNSKSVILLYHVYHAKQEGSIHDWERIEVRINNVNGVPGGAGEAVRYVAMTTHSDHKVRYPGDGDLNFMPTSTGKHVMVWQAQWSGNYPSKRKQELRFVEDAWYKVAADNNQGSKAAQVEITGSSSKKNVNYLFMCDCSSGAVNYWGGQTIAQNNAVGLTSGIRAQADWNQIPRVKYELQDLADILQSHTPAGNYSNHWKDDSHEILLAAPLRSESGAVEVAAGQHTFTYISIDDESSNEDREGYPDKSWFWGAYDMGGSTALKNSAFSGNSSKWQGGSRGSASGMYNSHNQFYWQHDYFAHEGTKGLSSDFQFGKWLPGNWHTPAAGGFDGRWVQLFAD